MVHLNSDQLAEAALEDSGLLSSEMVAHLLDCAGCQTELARLRRAANLLRNADRDSLQRPAGHVWARIQADLAADRFDLAPEAVRPTSPPGALIRTSRPRWARRGLVLLAAAAGLAVGIGGTIVARAGSAGPLTWWHRPSWLLFPGTAEPARLSSCATMAPSSCGCASTATLCRPRTIASCG